ncbi:MAG: coniferyl aldehyde dehydrogenase [Thermodesulfobacteriota bacterium]
MMEALIRLPELEKKRSENEQIHYMDHIFDTQKAAFERNPVPDAGERIRHLTTLKEKLLEHQEAIIAAIDQDFGGRSRNESLLAEILPSVEGIRYTVKRVRKWMQPSRRKVGLLFQPGGARVVYQPLGLVGIIVPWNYPVYLALGPLTGALSAGNRVMIKMSEYTPRTAAALKKMLYEAFDEDHVAVVTGEADVGVAFSRKPWDHLVFTGSTAVGRQVMKSAADNLTPVTLELGGKSPAIIGPDAPIRDAAQRIAFGKVFNAGQTCVAPDYVLCPRGAVDRFVESFSSAVAGMYPSLVDNPHYTGIINERQHQRLQGLVTDAAEKGARITTINPAGEDFSETRKMPVRVMTEVDESMRILQEEIFGPLLPVIPYDTLKDAVAYVNKHPRPLALYYFDYDREKVDYVVSRTFAGGMVVNDTLAHVAQDDLPFGGVGPSGMGEYHGHEGFLAFSKAKGVLYKQRLNSTGLIYPPYGRWIHRLIYRLFLR